MYIIETFFWVVENILKSSSNGDKDNVNIEMYKI